MYSFKQISFISGLLGLSLACNQKDRLTPLTAISLESKVVNSVNVNFCTDPAYNQKQYLKTIIILDHSTSNRNNYLMMNDGSGNSAVPFAQGPQYGTDPTGVLRYGNVATPGTLLNYLANLPANDPIDPTKYFALIDFSTNVQTYPPNASGFTSDIPDFFNYVRTDSATDAGRPNDQGNTNYLDTLRSAKKIIDQDIIQATACAAMLPTAAPTLACPKPGVEIASSYVIIFMSDGAPVVQTAFDSNGNLILTKQDSTDILAEVNAIASLTSNARFVTSVNLFTIFYYVATNIDNTAKTLLDSMARIGNGIPYSAVSGSSLDYSQFQPPAKRITYAVSDVFVSNASVTWWTDGKLHADTDMDGLPDDVEIAWGSDYRNPMTDGNGVSDLVKYYVTNGAPCTQKNAMGRCTDPVANYRATTCSGLSFVGGKFPSSDPDGLNDCEKRVLGDIGGINLPDSNGDLIPDWMEFKNGIPFQLGTAPAVNTPNQDGHTVYQKIKYSLPMNMSAQQMINLSPATYTMNLVRSTPDQDCYSLNVNDLPVIGSNNTFRVDIIMKSDMLRATYLYKVGKKIMPTGANRLIFNDWTDAGEIAANTWVQWR